MKFNFKVQQYQTDAVAAVIKVFGGQRYQDKLSYVHDIGKVNAKFQQIIMGLSDEKMEIIDPLSDTGYKNENIGISDEQLLKNIQTLQSENNIK